MKGLQRRELAGLGVEEIEEGLLLIGGGFGGRGGFLADAGRLLGGTAVAASLGLARGFLAAEGLGPGARGDVGRCPGGIGVVFGTCSYHLDDSRLGD